MSAKLTKKAVLDRILSEKVFAVLRLQRTDAIAPLIDAIVAGGITTIEVTLNSKNGFDVLHRIAHDYPQCLVGAGTVIGVEAATRAIECGAKFLVSPVTDLDMLAVCEQVRMVSMAGALTPTEAWQASQAGADLVKLFPLTGLGPSYIKALRGPLPNIRYVATNGATLQNVGEFFAAGASAVGVGTPLVSDADIERGDMSIITERAREIVRNAKG